MSPISALSNRKVKSAVSYIVLNYAQIGLSLFINLFLANLLGPTQYGILSYGIVLAGAMTVLVAFGEERSLVRDLIQSNNSHIILLASTILRIGLAAVGMIALAVWFFRWSGENDNICPILLCATSGILMGLTPRAWFDSRYEMGKHALICFLERCLYCLSILFIFITASLPNNVVAVAICLFLSRSLCVTWQWLHTYRTLRISFTGLAKAILFLLSQNIFIWGAALSNLLMTHANQVILGNKTGMEALAYYNLSFQMILVLRMVQMQTLRILAPAIAKGTDIQGSASHMRSLWLHSMGYAIGITVIIVLPLFFAGPPLVRRFMRPDYVNAIPCFQVMLLWSCVYGPAIINNQFLIGLRLNSHYLWITATFGIISVILAYLWIPEYGPIGAAYSLLASHTGSVVTQGWVVWRKSIARIQKEKKGMVR